MFYKKAPTAFLPGEHRSVRKVILTSLRVFPPKLGLPLDDVLSPAWLFFFMKTATLLIYGSNRPTEFVHLSKFAEFRKENF